MAIRAAKHIGAMRVKLTNMLSIFADSLGQVSNFQSIVINGCSPAANLIFPACLGKCPVPDLASTSWWTAGQRRTSHGSQIVLTVGHTSTSTITQGTMVHEISTHSES